jgi:hypothetical protein
MSARARCPLLWKCRIMFVLSIRVRLGTDPCMYVCRRSSTRPHLPRRSSTRHRHPRYPPHLGSRPKTKRGMKCRLPCLRKSRPRLSCSRHMVCVPPTSLQAVQSNIQCYHGIAPLSHHNHTRHSPAVVLSDLCKCQFSPKSIGIALLSGLCKS